jgi:hypothetical protein
LEIARAVSIAKHYRFNSIRVPIQYALRPSSQLGPPEELRSLKRNWLGSNKFESQLARLFAKFGAHPAQEGGGDANKHPASGSLAVSVCFFISILCRWPRTRSCSFHRRERSRRGSCFERKEFRLLHRSLGKTSPNPFTPHSPPRFWVPMTNC